MSDSADPKTEVLKEIVAELRASGEGTEGEIRELEEIVENRTEPILAEPFVVESTTPVEEVVALAAIPEGEAASTPAVEEGVRDIRAQIRDMSIPQKIKLAMFGNSVCRALLIMDRNRLIQGAVLKNPKLQFPEIEVFSRNPHVSEQVLRTISDNRDWMSSYVMKINLVSNAKSPPDISMKWLRYLNTPELKRLARSKNIPQIVTNTARKRLADQAEK